MLTQKKQDDYMAKNGTVCPECQSKKLDAGQIEVDGKTAWCPVECLDCGSTWEDVYTLSGIQKLSGL